MMGGGTGSDSRKSSSETDGAIITEETSDFDLGLVEWSEDESEAINVILSVKNTTQDKLAYTIFSLNIFFTCFIIGYIPQYFYLLHTVKALILVSYRWYSYKKQRYHYFMFDFCYFTNFLLLVYLWVPDCLLFMERGRLFTICFCFAFGPVLAAIVMWRNSLVPHSNDKMTSLFIHVSPAMSLWGIRWFSSAEQGFLLCSNQDTLDPSGCSHVDSTEILYYPMVIYIVWQILYILIVEILRKERVKEQQYTTSFKYIVESSKSSPLVRLISVFGPRYRKAVYIVLQLVYTVLAMQLAYYCYFYKYLCMVAVAVVMSCASYNGASFYIDVFSIKYQSSLKKSK